jgi:BirA family biotin operon repressor/biotin-[acetyl-CoA-carboxylase] ligase
VSGGGAPLPPVRSPLGGLAPLGGRRFARLHNLIFVGTTPSTNDLGKAIVERMLAESEEIRLTVVIAGEQTAGRGRSGRPWTSLPGALALSAIVPWPEGPRRVRLPVETGILLARGLAAAFGVDVRLKWPNDLLVARKKLGGLLVEARANDEGEGWAVIGLGLNVRGTRADLDARGLPDAVSLEACGVAPALLEGDGPLEAVLSILDEGIGEPADDPLPDAFAAVSAHAPGDLVAVSDGDRTRRGAFAGVTPEGFLRLATEAGDETLVSGDVVLF